VWSRVEGGAAGQDGEDPRPLQRAGECGDPSLRQGGVWTRITRRVGVDQQRVIAALDQDCVDALAEQVGLVDDNACSVEWVLRRAEVRQDVGYPMLRLGPEVGHFDPRTVSKVRDHPARAAGGRYDRRSRTHRPTTHREQAARLDQLLQAAHTYDPVLAEGHVDNS